MNLKNACCCLSARMGTLIFSYLFLIYSGWSVWRSFIKLEDPIYKAFFEEFSFIFCCNIMFDLIGILIFLIIILSICNNTSPCISLLNTAIVFLVLREIYVVYRTFQLVAAIDHLADVIIDKDARKLLVSSRVQDAYRNLAKRVIQLAFSKDLKQLYMRVAIEILIVLYSLLVFFGYKTELKENPVDFAPVRRNVEEANFSKPSAPHAYNLHVPAPQYQYSYQPPQFSSHTPQYSVEFHK